MIAIKMLSIVVIICSMLYSPVVSYAVVAVGKGAASKGLEASTGQASGNKISRVTGFVKTMDNNTLLLEDGSQYDLAGVTVINKTPNKSVTGKTAVELTFINRSLNQVVIH